MKRTSLLAGLFTLLAHGAVGQVVPGTGAVLNAIRPASNPHLAFATTTRRWLVAWEEEVGNRFGPQITCRLVDATGTPAGAARSTNPARPAADAAPCGDRPGIAAPRPRSRNRRP